MKAVELAPHEFTANYLFNGDGLAPFFAADSVIKDYGGATGWFEFRDDGERWQAKLVYQPSGIVNPGDTTPQGTRFEMQEMREFRFKVRRHPEEDPVGEQDFDAHMAPRWEGMQAERNDGTRTEIPVPEGFREGVNVRISGSNIKFSRYQKLLMLAAGHLGIASRYFENPHPMSNTQDAELYVRLAKDRSGPVHARDGPIASLAHLLESDRDGYRKLVQNERDERGRHLPGYYHTVTLGARRIEEAFPSHQLPKEIKHYYAREAASKSDDHPLAHPKLGASYQVSRWDGKLGVSADDLAQLHDELSETVLSVLADAGIPIRPGDDGSPFVDDSYFEATEREYDFELTSLDLTEIREHQESVVIKHVADGLSPVEWESLETLVADGGKVAPADIAEENDRHVDSVRRALDRIPELVEADYGEVRLRSNHIAEHVHEAVQEAKDATRRAVEAGAKAREAAERGVDESTSALIAWAAKHGIDVDDRREGQLKLRMASVENVEARLREAYRLWTEAGKDAMRFREARVELGERGIATAWHYL